MMDLITQQIRIAGILLETRSGEEKNKLQVFVEDTQAIHRYMDGHVSDVNFWEDREFVHRYEEVEAFMAKYRRFCQD
jgi:predicted RNA-binding protein